MTPGDSTEPMTSTGSAGSSLPKFPTRPEDVQAHRAAVKAERAAQESTAAAAVKASAAAPACAAARPPGSPGRAASTGSRPAPGERARQPRPTGPATSCRASTVVGAQDGAALGRQASRWSWQLPPPAPAQGHGRLRRSTTWSARSSRTAAARHRTSRFGRVVSLSIVFAVIDVVIFTAIATRAPYETSASLVGGLADADRRLTTSRRLCARREHTAYRFGG